MKTLEHPAARSRHGEIRPLGSESGQGAAALSAAAEQIPDALRPRAQGNAKVREDYNKWRDTAQKAMVKYQVGEMSFEQFAECVQIP